MRGESDCFVDKQALVTRYTFASEIPTKMGEIRFPDTTALGYASFSPQGDMMMGISEYGHSGTIYDLKNVETKHTIKAPRPSARQEETALITSTFSDNGDHVWISNERGEIQVYDSKFSTTHNAHAILFRENLSRRLHMPQRRFFPFAFLKTAHPDLLCSESLGERHLRYAHDIPVSKLKSGFKS